MSKQEMTSGESAPVVVVEQTPSSRHKPYRPTEMQQDGSPELHKRSRAPAVPSVTEDIKDTMIAKDIGNTKERVEGDRALSAERQSHHVKKSPSKRRGSSPEDIAMEHIDTQKENITSLPQPIPDTDTLVSEGKKDYEKIDKEKKADEDSITGEIAEVRTAEPAKDHSGWSDDEEAGGLPRSESRGSWMTRTMRQLFCCGVRYNPTSEEELTRVPEASGI